MTGTPAMDSPCGRHVPPCRLRGFTLVEVLVAISIFAVVAVGVYRVLSAMVETQDKVVSHAASLRELQRALWVMAADFDQLVMRDIKLSNEDREPALIADVDDYILQITRQGLRNPMLVNRSELQRVAYSLGPAPRSSGDEVRDEGRHLLRHTWTALDRIDDTEEIVQVLLRDVEEVEMEFMDEEGDWKEDWPEKKMDDKAHTRELPRAVRFKIETKRYGTVERFFQTGNVIHKEKVGEGNSP